MLAAGLVLAQFACAAMQFTAFRFCRLAAFNFPGLHDQALLAFLAGYAATGCKHFLPCFLASLALRIALSAIASCTFGWTNRRLGDRRRGWRRDRLGGLDRWVGFSQTRGAGNTGWAELRQG